MQYSTQRMALAMAFLASASAAPQATTADSADPYNTTPTAQYSSVAVNAAVAHSTAPARILVVDHPGEVTKTNMANTTVVRANFAAETAAADNALTLNIRNTLNEPLALFNGHNPDSPAALVRAVSPDG